MDRQKDRNDMWRVFQKMDTDEQTNTQNNFTVDTNRRDTQTDGQTKSWKNRVQKSLNLKYLIADIAKLHFKF